MKLETANDNSSSEALNQDKSYLGQLGKLLSIDYFPNFTETYFGWLRRPIGWVICGAAISGLAGLGIDPRGFIFMWSFLVFLAFGTIWPWMVIKGTRCELVFSSDRTQEGQETSAVLRVTNRLPLPIFGLTVEGPFLQDIGCENDNIVVALKRIPACSLSDFKWSFEPSRRGMIPTENPEIVTGFPFGIYQARRTVSVAHPIVVWPKTVKLDSVPPLSGTNFNVSGNMSDRAGSEGDVIGARHYRQGDSLRQVNWSLSAKSNRLVVVERQSAAQQPIHVILDLSLGSSQPSEGFSNSAFEWRIRVAASICKQFHLRQSLIQLSCLGLPADFSSSLTNQKGLSRLLDFLAEIPDETALRRSMESDEVLFSGLKNSEHLRDPSKIYFVTGQENAGLANQWPNTTVLICDQAGDQLAGPNEMISRSNTRLDLSLQRPEQELQLGWERISSSA